MKDDDLLSRILKLQGRVAASVANAVRLVLITAYGCSDVIGSEAASIDRTVDASSAKQRQYRDESADADAWGIAE